MLLPDFIDRWRRRLATPAERFIAIHDLAMKAALGLSVLLGIIVSYLFETALARDSYDLVNAANASPVMDIIMVIILSVVFTVIFTSILQLVYRRWLYQRIIKKWPKWPADFK